MRWSVRQRLRWKLGSEGNEAAECCWKLCQSAAWRQGSEQGLHGLLAAHVEKQTQGRHGGANAEMWAESAAEKQVHASAAS